MYLPDEGESVPGSEAIEPCPTVPASAPAGSVGATMRQRQTRQEGVKHKSGIENDMLDIVS